MEFKEIIDDVKDSLGDKGFLFLIIGIVVVFLVVLTKQSNEGQDTETMVVGLTSYPDAVTNANVIIDTLQDSLQYSEDNIITEIKDGNEGILESINVNFEATNDYINKGIESQLDLTNKVSGEIIGDLTDVKNSLKGSETSVNVQTKTEKKEGATYYTYKTKAGLNTNTSIVDALKAIGIDSSMTNRKKIAQANGISNYTGTYKQNVELLGKLKNGKLKKV